MIPRREKFYDDRIELPRYLNEGSLPDLNQFDLSYRALLGREIVLRDLTDEDRQALEELRGNRREWHLFKGTKHYDGKRETVVTFQMGLLAAMDAHPFGFLEGDGAIDRRVKPVEGLEEHISTSGRRSFDAHIDHAWLRFPWEPDDGRAIIPDFMSLGGYYNPNQIGTLFADRRDILEAVSELTAYELERPNWSFPSPPSVRPASIATGLPIVTRGPDRLPAIRLNPRIISETHRAVDALEELLHVMKAERLWTEIVLEPGDAVVARGTALHKRGEVVGDRELTAIYGRHRTTRSRVVSEANWYLEPVH